MMGRRAFITGSTALPLAGCAALEAIGASDLGQAVQNATVLELVGLGPDIACDVDRFEARRSLGAFLQIPEGTLGGQPFAVSGRLKGSNDPLPRNILVDDSRIRALSPDDDGALSGLFQSSATPIVTLNSGTALPLAYTLSYRADGTRFTGPLVIGKPPVQEDIPQLGLTVMAGFVEVTRTSFANDGSQSVTKAIGRFEIRIGYGSGRATFEAQSFGTTEGAALPFDRLSWNRLGICGAQVVSSGQGVLKLYDKNDVRVPIFTGATDPSAGSLVFQSNLFDGGTQPGPPGGIGGVFAVQGDSSSITAAFVSQTSSELGVPS